MDSWVFLSFFMIVVGIPVIFGVGRDIFKRWATQLEIEATMAAEKAAQYAAGNQRLEQRVAVLERILTDRSTKLAEEIEDLRDRPLDS